MCYWSQRCDSTTEQAASAGLPDVQGGVHGRNVPIECAGCHCHLRYEFQPDSVQPSDD